MVSNIIPKGFKDDVTSQVASEHQYKNIIINHFQLNGYHLVKTPLIEYVDEYTSKNAFKIEVLKHEEKLTIRDDITLQIARLSETRLSKKIRPLKLCYYGEVVRKIGTMLRPERQFLQIGAECIGEESYLADIEMMELAFTSLTLVGIKNITIEISSRIFFDKFMSFFKNSKKKDEIKRLIKIKDLKGILKILDSKHHKYIIDLFSCTGNYGIKKSNLEKIKIDKSTFNEVKNINNIVNNFLPHHKFKNIFLDLCEIDDANYHTGVRFTFYANDIRGEIARGGRYISKGIGSVSTGTGFTCYMDSILRASSEKTITKRIIIPFNTSKHRIDNLIKRGYASVRHTGRLKITRKFAKQQNCQFYLENNSIKKV